MRRIEGVRIRNFRSHGDARLDKLADLNLLYGDNGAGKSSFPRALALIAQSMRPSPDGVSEAGVAPSLVLSGCQATLFDAGFAWGVFPDHASSSEPFVELGIASPGR